MLTSEELADIRNAVPHLDAMALRALRRAGYDVVHLDTALAVRDVPVRVAEETPMLPS